MTTNHAMRGRTRVTRGALALALALGVSGYALPAVAVEEPSSPSADEMVLEGDSDGTVFGKLTVTGEDRIHIEFERPVLQLDLDARDTPGLEWGDPLGVLQRSGVDLAGPFLRESAAIPVRGLADDWLSTFREDGVARFRPALEGVDRWRLTIVDSRSDTVATFDGRGDPPEEIVWDGVRLDGTPAAPGLVYSYVLVASDKAGNRRTFPGAGFELPPYRVDGDDGLAHLFAGTALPDGWAARPAGPTPKILLEVASRINRAGASAPVEIRVRARSFDAANALAEAVKGAFRERLLGDPARLRSVTDVRADAPESGTVAIVTTRRAGA